MHLIDPSPLQIRRPVPQDTAILMRYNVSDEPCKLEPGLSLVERELVGFLTIG